MDSEGVPPIVSILSAHLQRVTDLNDSIAAGCRLLPQPQPQPQPQPPQASSSFRGLTKQEISVRCYLDRIFQFAHCSPSCYVVAYIYLDRFVHLNPFIAIDSFSVHRLLISAVLTSVKFMEDRSYNNAYFAKVGGISLTEMNYLEVDFLFGLRFELNVAPDMFNSYCSALQREMRKASPQIPAKLHCFISEEETTSSCNQKQVIV